MIKGPSLPIGVMQTNSFYFINPVFPLYPPGDIAHSHFNFLGDLL